MAVKRPPFAAANYLGHAVTYHCSNIKCGHYRKIPVSVLVHRYGEDLDMNDFERRLRCSKCGARDPRPIFSWLMNKEA
ncbi:hypothetical protein [Paracoccus siganidrum]|uniref:Uncharacterized protein n=1 Tax=Paracoccus siganidrum TaxID=1276757 RepID=A0A419A400_9RHOB|nr:hypothetical protein [Paracoccus siganidrum]RJL08392.1 hypothetical protein D3P05_16105 [Paracoccus siganidrum]RMC39304.1 hypothetical protein C9E82_04820 [Paracoccus siganidrum]